MKIEKRVKGRLTFKTSIGNVTLTDDNEGINELTAEQFAAIEAHPMFEAISKTSGLRVIEEKAAAKPAPKKAGKVEAPSEDEGSDKEGDEVGDELEAKNKAELVALAEEKGIQTKGLNKAQLIEAINEANAE